MGFDTEFTTIEKADHCIVLCSRDEPYILSQKSDVFLSKSKTILVYAENVQLDGSLKLPGKHIGLFCHQLQIKGTTEVTIDVSGVNGGPPAAAKPVGTGAEGGAGQTAGSVNLYVESSSADLDRLHIRALGGDGGQGGSTSDPDSEATGGKGGKGGNAGTVGDTSYI